MDKAHLQSQSLGRHSELIDTIRVQMQASYCVLTFSCNSWWLIWDISCRTFQVEITMCMPIDCLKNIH